MCYTMSYNCNVGCINGDLNQSLISSGIFETTSGRPCTIVCDSGEMISHNFQNASLFDIFSINAPVIFAILFLCFLCLIASYLLYKRL